MSEIDNSFRSAAKHFKAAEAELLDAEKSLRELSSRLDNSLQRLDRLGGYDSIFIELQELLRRRRAGAAGQLRPVKP